MTYTYQKTEKLLKKYNNEYCKGETRSREYERKHQQKRRLNERLDLLDIILLDAKSLYLTNTQKEQVKYLIKKYSNQFKKLHGKASSSAIILSFIFYLKKCENPNIQVEKYFISHKYGLNHNMFETIICRLIQDYMKQDYLKCTTTTKYNHEYLADNHELIY